MVIARAVIYDSVAGIVVVNVVSVSGNDLLVVKNCRAADGSEKMHAIHAVLPERRLRNAEHESQVFQLRHYE